MIKRLLSPLSNFIQKRFDVFIAKRLPPARKVTLNNNNIFIFPTAMGFCYLAIVFLLFLLGTNYQNNVIILLSYLMASMFITISLASFFNVKGVQFSSKKEYVGFSDKPIVVNVSVNADLPRFNYLLQYPGHSLSIFDQLKDKQTLPLTWQAPSRGVFKPGRIKVVSEYAYGLFRVWSWLDFDHQLVVFPTPRPITSKQLAACEDGNEEGRRTEIARDGDEFIELSNYREGESLSRIAWKQLARGQGKYTKQYHQILGEAKYLSFEHLPPVSVEHKLEFLTYLILEYSQNDASFGLDLPTIRIDIGHGEEHKLACLTALARYPLSHSSSTVSDSELTPKKAKANIVEGLS